MCGNSGLFCGNVGLFRGNVGLFCRNVGTFCGHVLMRALYVQGLYGCRESPDEGEKKETEEIKIGSAIRI